MEFNYAQIKELARESGRKVSDLIALASQNDPFYVGTPGDVQLAEWFANLWYEMGEPRAHLRRVHYAAVSKRILLPNGLPYENTVECWDTIMQASKFARYLHLVDPAAFMDKKNQAPIIHATEIELHPDLQVDDYLYRSDTDFPDFPALPDYRLYDYQMAQRYHLEVWCEKQTMNDVLEPLCARYGMNLQTGAGELSITATLALAERIRERKKPARILYVSDFDPAGQSMPVAIARKLEYFVRSEHLDDLDIRLFPVVLTAQQVQQYQLPRIPIKESELRRGRFEQQHGQGAVELDALEALQPGELNRIMRGYIERYYDTTLTDRIRESRETLEGVLQSTRQEILDRHQDEIDAARALYDELKTEYAPRMQVYREQLAVLWQAISKDLNDQIPDLDEHPVPEGYDGDELGDGLYNSQRDYLEQIAAYKQFQGK